MNFEKFEGEKLNEEQMHPVSGGRRVTITNCGTASTDSTGQDADVDAGGNASDEDTNIEVSTTSTGEGGN